MKRFSLFLVWLVLLGGARADELIALRDGETLTFRVSWGIFGNAGEITVAAADEMIEDLPHLRVTTRTVTRGIVKKLYPFEGDADSLFDTRDGRLLAAKATTRAGKKNTQAMIVFDYTKAEANYVDNLRAERNATLSLPPARPMDFITSLIQARAWDLKPGQSHDVHVLFDDEFYWLTITAEKVETISTPDGDVPALLLIPRMNGTPKGMFRRGGEVRVWLSQDARRVPLRFEVKLKVGTAVAVLTDYQPAKPTGGRTAAETAAAIDAERAVDDAKLANENPRP